MLRQLLSMVLLCLAIPMAAFAQSTLKGTVIDSQTGEALPGVNVFIEELSKGAATDLDGKYNIEGIETGTYTIKARFTGYNEFTETVTISGSVVTLNIDLEPSVEMLEEVVVTGYTEVGKNKITGSVSVVSSEKIESVPVASFDQILQGQSAGLFVGAGSGQPGSAATVRIRGVSSITGSNTPLYILDGTPISAGDFAALNPGDFQSVSVLKDASSTAAYGSRGANGVIVITTKKGVSGKTKIRYQHQLGFSEAGDFKFDMMNSVEKLAFEEKIGRGAGWAVSPNNPANAGRSAAELQTAYNDYASVNNDWADIFFRRGVTTSHNLSFTGGNNSTRYFLSTNIFNQEGIALNSALDRYTVRLNLDHNIDKSLSFSFKTQVGYAEEAFVGSENSVSLANPFAAAYLANPYEKLYNDDGTIATGGGKVGANAYERLNKEERDENTIKAVGSMGIEYNYNEWLVKGEFMYDVADTKTNQFQDPTSYAGTLNSNGNAGFLTKWNEFERRFQTNLRVGYTKEFGDHFVQADVINETISYRYDYNGYTGYGLNEKLPNTPAGITPGTPDNNMIPSVDGSITENAMLSQIALLSYNFKEKYNLKLSYRRDGSSRFGEDNRYANLYSIGASWVITNEDFMAKYDFVDDLMLRASYGRTGNQSGIGNFESKATYGTVSYAGITGYAPSSVGNAGLKWELSDSYNAGVDFSLLKYRIEGTFEAYYRLTSDLFVDQTLSRTAGFGSLSINAGKMSNKGIEISLTGYPIRTKDMTLSIGVNYSDNVNTIEDLGQVNEFESGTSIIREGLSIGTHYIVGWAGVDPATGEPLYYNKDGQVTNVYADSDARAIYGTYIAPRNGGFNVDYKYKGFGIRAQFNFSEGFSRFNNQTYFQENAAFSGYNLSTIMLDMWEKPGDVTEVQSYLYGREFSSKDIEDASYLRFRNLYVSYAIPRSWLKKIGTFERVTLFAQGQNLKTWTKFTGFDPEDNNNIAQYEYPLPRTYTFGIDVNF